MLLLVDVGGDGGRRLQTRWEEKSGFQSWNNDGTVPQVC